MIALLLSQREECPRRFNLVEFLEQQLPVVNDNIAADEIHRRLGPMARNGGGLNLYVLISKRLRQIADALVDPSHLRDNALHCEADTVIFQRFASQPGHIPILSMNRQHHVAACEHRALLPEPEEVRLALVEQLTDHLEEDIKLVAPLGFSEWLS